MRAPARLNVVPAPAGSVATLAERIARLQSEARALATEQVAALLASLDDVQRLSAEIAVGGEAFPVGVREIARRLAEDAESTVAVITAIGSRR